MSVPSGSTKPRSFDLDVEGAQYNRLQAKLKYKISLWLGAAALVLFVVAGATWMHRWGHAPSDTVITTVYEAGQEVSRREVTTSASPLVAVPIALAVVGLVLLAPIVSWAIAPGSRVKGPLGTESGADHPGIEPTPLATARRMSNAAIEKTSDEVTPMVQTVSSKAEDSELMRDASTEVTEADSGTKQTPSAVLHWFERCRQQRKKPPTET